MKELYYVDRNEFIFRISSEDRESRQKKSAFTGVRACPRELESLVWIDQECSLQGADEEPRSRVYPWSGCSRATVASEQGSLVLVKNVF